MKVAAVIVVLGFAVLAVALGVSFYRYNRIMRHYAREIDE